MLTIWIHQVIPGNTLDKAIQCARLPEPEQVG
jgi:hypothetical protein